MSSENSHPAIRDNQVRHRNWMFTSFSSECPKFTDCMTYMVYQLEIAPSTLREHYQGYVIFKFGKTLSSVKKEFKDKSIHLETRKGSQKQAIDYCTKEDTRKPGTKPVEFGEKKEQGARNDLDTLTESVLAGSTKLELLRAFGGNALRHLGMIDRAQKAIFHLDPMDKYILKYRSIMNIDTTLLFDQVCTEVSGNTSRTLKSDAKKIYSKQTFWSDSESDSD